MSVVLQVKGEMIQSLAQMVRQAGDQQREIVIELSQELNKHNKLIEKALDRQERIIEKVSRIEDKLMTKELYNYQRIQEEIERRK